MPYATIHAPGLNANSDLKARLHERTTDVLVERLGAARSIVAVRIVQDEKEDWSVAGRSLGSPSDEGGGTIVVVTIAREAVTEAQIEDAVAAMTAMLAETIGPGGLPPYVVFELIEDHAWGYKGRTLARIRQARARSGN